MVSIALSSSEDTSLCQHARSSAGPSDWAGGEIVLKHNGQYVYTVKRGFNSWVRTIHGVDVANDKLQLESTSTDGVCITGLFINGIRQLVGRNNNLHSFWIDGDDQYCLDNFMSSTRITIQNGRVTSSTC